MAARTAVTIETLLVAGIRADRRTTERAELPLGRFGRPEESLRPLLSRPVHPAGSCAQVSCSGPLRRRHAQPALRRRHAQPERQAGQRHRKSTGCAEHAIGRRPRTPGHLDAWTPILAFARTRWELADFADATLRDGSCRVRVTATVAGGVIRSATGQGVASR